MSDYLSNLISRSYGSQGSVQPRPRSIFEPPAVSDRLIYEIDAGPDDQPVKTDNAEANEIRVALPGLISELSSSSERSPDKMDGSFIKDEATLQLKAAQAETGQTKARQISAEQGGISLQSNPRSSLQPNPRLNLRPDSRSNLLGQTYASDVVEAGGVVESAVSSLSRQLGISMPFIDKSKQYSRKHFITGSTPDKFETGKADIGKADTGKDKSVRELGQPSDYITGSKTDLSEGSELDLVAFSEAPTDSRINSSDIIINSSNVNHSNIATDIITQIPQLRKGMLSQTRQEPDHRLPIETKIKETADSEPEIHVTVGRVEVRAIMSPQPVRTQAPEPRPGLSLDDYLKRLNGGKS